MKGLVSDGFIALFKALNIDEVSDLIDKSMSSVKLRTIEVGTFLTYSINSFFFIWQYEYWRV